MTVVDEIHTVLVHQGLQDLAEAAASKVGKSVLVVWVAVTPLQDSCRLLLLGGVPTQ